MWHFCLCLFSSCFLLVPREGCASCLWHFLVNFTYMFNDYCCVSMLVANSIHPKGLMTFDMFSIVNLHYST